MSRLLLLWPLVLVCLSGCVARERINVNCKWTHDAAFPIDLRNQAHQQHLTDDTDVAEELAIRYGDEGLRVLGHFASMDEYLRARDECMATLFNGIASSHEVSAQQVRQSVGRRRTSFDATVILSFAAFYAFVSGMVAQRIFRRLRDERWLALATALVVSTVVSAVGLMLGELWSGFAEGLKVGISHMSYRAFRIPWANHRAELFVAGIVLFWLTALLQYWVVSHDNQESAFNANIRGTNRTLLG
jgi:hypothetical protein